MKVGIAADHGGFEVKQQLLEKLKNSGYEIRDFGAFSIDITDDYPDFVIPLAKAVASGELERGIAICGSGVGACIVANKVKGVRAALITDSYSAHQGVEHDNMNLICFGGRVIGSVLIAEMTDLFLKAKFTSEERHMRRLNKIKELEE